MVVAGRSSDPVESGVEHADDFRLGTNCPPIGFLTDCKVVCGLYPRAPVLSEVEVCRDPDDNHVLALALDTESDYILTGDGDLLVLNPWRGIMIVSPRTFLET